MPDETPDKPTQPFPVWLRELCHYGGILIALTIFILTIKSDQRSTSEKLDRLSQDVANFSDRLAGIESRLPNKEADGLKFKVLEEKVDRNKSDTDFAIAKLEKWKEDVTADLIRKGVM